MGRGGSLPAVSGHGVTLTTRPRQSLVAAFGGRRLCVLAVVYFTCAAGVELILEDASRHSGSLRGPEVAFILSIGEFTGCCVVALACGGRFTDAVGDKDSDADCPEALWTRATNYIYMWLPYTLLAVLLCCGTGLANLAVAWVHFPVKVVIKSSKLIPTMAVSAVVGNSRSFTRVEYAAALLVCLGTAGFSLQAGRTDAPPGMATVGVCMLLTAILADVIVVNLQQWMMQKRGVVPMSLVLRQNFMGLCCLIMAMCLTVDPVAMVARAVEQRVVLKHAIGAAFVTGACVYANTYLVKEAGSVSQVALSTLRKFVTVVLSYALFPKPITTLHMVAFSAVASGILLSSIAPLRRGAPKQVSVRLVACKGDDGHVANEEP